MRTHNYGTARVARLGQLLHDHAPLPEAYSAALEITDEDIKTASPNLRPGLIAMREMAQEWDPYRWHSTASLC